MNMDLQQPCYKWVSRTKSDSEYLMQTDREIEVFVSQKNSLNEWFSRIQTDLRQKIRKLDGTYSTQFEPVPSEMVCRFKSQRIFEIRAERESNVE